MPLTCLACRTVFPSNELQKAHYQTEWHRYNLKRKIVELPPVSQEDFELKRLTAELQGKTNTGSNRGTKTAVPTEEFDPSRQQLRCVLCQKNFHSTKALNNHLKSKKHLACEKNQPDKSNNMSRQQSSGSRTSESFDISSQLAAEINTSGDCVQLVSKPERAPLPKTPSNQYEMASDEDWESDDEEWSEDEEMDVDEDIDPALTSFDPLRCVFCWDVRTFESIDENLDHMQVNHTFFVPYPHLVADISQLLCYLHYKVEVLRQCVLCSLRSKQFRGGDAVRRHMFDKGHTRMAQDTPQQFLEYVSFYNEPEDSEDATDDPTGEKLEELLAAALEDDFNLVLPSGAVIGHRALNRYYRQKPRAPIDLENEKRIQENSRRYIGFRANQNNVSNSRAVELSRNVLAIRELKVIDRFRSKRIISQQVKQNNLKTHSRDQNFWNMRY